MKFWDYRVTAALGALLWGSWALFVNWDAGVSSAALSAVTQATVSATSITLLGLLANFVLSRPWRTTTTQVVAGTLIPYGVLLSIVVTAHVIVQTHDILRTILPSNVIGILYSAMYAYKNRRTSSVGAAAATDVPA